VTKRHYSLEASLQLYSSEPSVMTPADLYDAVGDPAFRDQFVGTNLYVITCRPRILIAPEGVDLVGTSLVGHLMVMREHGWERVAFCYPLQLDARFGAARPSGVDVATNGTRLLVRCANGSIFIAAHVLVAHAEVQLSQAERDLCVLYVGQAIGRRRARLAVDRLISHTTLQRILADFHTNQPEWEVLILFYRFEHSRLMLNSGGNLNLEPSASLAEERAHLDEVRAASTARRERITLAEASLIHYFKPLYNTVFKKTDFVAAAKKRKFMKSVMRNDMIGLIVEVNSANLRARLYSDQRPAQALDASIEDTLRDYAATQVGNPSVQADINQLLMSHVISVPLTDPEVRDSFLHGMQWHGSDNREPWL
jgi:hypothetical protein